MTDDSVLTETAIVDGTTLSLTQTCPAVDGGATPLVYPYTAASVAAPADGGTGDTLEFVAPPSKGCRISYALTRQP